MINEDAGEILADRFLDQGRGHGRIDAAREGAENLLVPHFRPNFLDFILNERIALPTGGTTADVINEVLEHLLSFFAMNNFGMELGGIKFFRPIFEGGIRTGFRTRCPDKTLRKDACLIVMGHEDVCRRLNILK